MDGSGVKAMQGWLKYLILVNLIIVKKENTGSQMGHTKKILTSGPKLIKRSSTYVGS
jgi:hypothetical protein